MESQVSKTKSKHEGKYFTMDTSEMCREFQNGERHSLSTQCHNQNANSSDDLNNEISQISQASKTSNRSKNKNECKRLLQSQCSLVPIHSL